MKYLLSLYETMYNNNIYIRRYIITTNIIVIHENVHRVIRDDV